MSLATKKMALRYSKQNPKDGDGEIDLFSRNRKWSCLMSRQN